MSEEGESVCVVAVVKFKKKNCKKFMMYTHIKYIFSISRSYIHTLRRTNKNSYRTPHTSHYCTYFCKLYLSYCVIYDILAIIVPFFKFFHKS